MTVMRHRRAVAELRKNYTRRGVWIWLRSYGLWRFVQHPSDVQARAERLTTGAFS